MVSVPTSELAKGRPLNDEELWRFKQAVPKVVGEKSEQSWLDLIDGMVASGLRLDEIMNLSWSDETAIRPIWSKGKLPVLYFPSHLQKNGKEQEIPLAPWLEDLLLQTPAERRRGWCFDPMSLQARFGRKFKGERLSSDRVGKILSRIGKKARIIVAAGDPVRKTPNKFASGHDLRRTFAQKCANSGLPPKLVSRLMRHASQSTTENYYQEINTQLDAGVVREYLKPVSENETEQSLEEKQV